MARHVTPAQLRPLCMQGKNLVTQKLNITLAAPEVLGGVPLGACAVRDPLVGEAKSDSCISGRAAEPAQKK